MEKTDIIEGYLRAEKPYDVCAHTRMGGYMEFMCIERGIMFEENARQVCDRYASAWGKSDNIKAICVRRHGTIIYEKEL